MVEIRIHGRGGQGSVTMAELVASAVFYDGKFSQAFPNFGVERRGAPVTAYVRIDDKFIRLRSQVYSPDYVIVQDATLLSDKNILGDLKKGAVVLINTSKPLEGLVAPKGVILKHLNASGIALEVLGKPIINTILLGAFASISGLFSLSGVDRAIKERFAGEMGEKNVLAARRGYEVISNN